MDKLEFTSADLHGAGDARRAKPRGNRSSRIPELIEASIRVFARDGYGGYSINRVAAEVGVRLSTLQHYFGTRDQLLVATIREVYGRYIDRYARLGANKLQPPEARLNTIIDEFFDDILVVDADVTPFVLECWALAEHDPAIAELVGAGNKQFQQIWLDLIAEINPALPEQECAIRASLIEAHAQGLMALCRRGGPDLPERQTLRHATKALWRAMSHAAH
ncbi:HTH-type transcriptional regulator BetI [Cupriavidus yeoncheonensis]|uniref:HTH-type transcriptional regulator BetI n=1 Tax=Cupriavidus yeoncheonensis TaxID=1462994 RepID=A0A916IWV8_9BURK|nr:TetR family transcriptional regulator [Cupriavidus yeoncheonensis]CAG2150687.1 HTH-type transcriptional regulator BetI [Cupriavidus yeoncheonensis]